MPLLDWTQHRRTLLKPGIEFDLDNHRYLRAIYENTAQKLILYKASQMGVSEYCISYALHACDQREANALYVFPTDTHVSDFSSARLGPAIEPEVSRYLARIVVDSLGTDGKRGVDRVTLKRVRDRFLYFRGAQVKKDGKAPQLKSIDADVLILDEIDEMDPRASSIAQKRLGHSQVAEERWVSTPSYPGVGIHQKWLESDQREWFVQCERCNRAQYLTIAHVVTEWDDLERPVSWYGQHEGRAFATCEQCGGELDRTGPGEWVAAHLERELAGYHLTHLFSAQVDLIDIVNALSTTNETRRKEAYNQDLGEPYKPRGGGLDDEILDACRRDYTHGPQPDERCVMGVDVGKILHVVIRAQIAGEWCQRWAGTVPNFDDVGRLMRRYRVTTCVVDALPETRKAREFQANWPIGRVWLAYYVVQKAGLKSEEMTQWNEEEGVVNLDRTRTLDETFARFTEQSNTLPGHARDIPDYYDHMKAPVRVTEKNNAGDVIARYVETGADHFAHAENYVTVAGMVPRRVPNVLAQGRARGWNP